jgi:hypothetical protein
MVNEFYDVDIVSHHACSNTKVNLLSLLKKQYHSTIIFYFERPIVMTDKVTWVMQNAPQPLTKRHNAFSIKIKQLQNQGNGWDFIVGITQKNGERKHDGNCGFGLTETSWGYISATGDAITNCTTNTYGHKLEVGDIVTVIVEFYAATLRFKVNGKDFGVAFRDIPVAQHLYPAISSICTISEIEVVSTN